MECALNNLGGLWEVAFLAGALLLGAALVYGSMSYNRRNHANASITDKATRELYANTDTYGDKEAKLRSEAHP